MASDSLDAALSTLRAGGVVAAATESSFGLLADIAQPGALDALFRLKPRDEARGVPVLLPDPDSWDDVVAGIPDVARRLAKRFWPGPLTIALPARAGGDARVLEQGTLGVRVPGPSAAAYLVRAYGRPLSATSANLPGAPPAITGEAVRQAFPGDNGVYVLPGTAPAGPPSTLVVIPDERTLRVVREGALPRAAIARAASEGSLD